MSQKAQFLLMHCSPKAVEAALKAAAHVDNSAIGAVAEPPPSGPGRTITGMTRMLLKTLAVNRRAKKESEKEAQEAREKK